jgi:hypothetical protein
VAPLLIKEELAMEIQKAEEFIATIAKDGCFFDSRGDFRLSTSKTAPLIRARDKAIIERCKEEISITPDPGEPSEDYIERQKSALDSILRDLD